MKIKVIRDRGGEPRDERDRISSLSNDMARIALIPFDYSELSTPIQYQWRAILVGLWSPNANQ